MASKNVLGVKGGNTKLLYLANSFILELPVSTAASRATHDAEQQTDRQAGRQAGRQKLPKLHFERLDQVTWLVKGKIVHAYVCVCMCCMYACVKIKYNEKEKVEHTCVYTAPE